MNNIPYNDYENFTEVMGVTNKLGQQRSINRTAPSLKANLLEHLDADAFG